MFDRAAENLSDPALWLVPCGGLLLLVAVAVAAPVVFLATRRPRRRR